MELIRGFITAFRTLSIIPVPGKDSANFSNALYGFSFVGGVLGAIQFGIVTGFYRLTGNQWPEGLALILVVVGILLTRGMHLDGLADFADGFWGGYNRTRTLAIMKDSFLGTFGVIALITVLLAKWIALVRLFELTGFAWIASAYLISRTMMVDLIVSFPYAREEGTAGPFIANAGKRHRVFSFTWVAGVLYLLNGLAGPAALAIVWSLTRFYGMYCMKRVGGITGDLLGAWCEMTETLVPVLAVIYILIETIYF
ncbi:MAG: adenosylcobinamide-GDP ribazoletransferase [Proteobacteria bacterium]|nr:adenosylcobinamide-GDP ribazoletransferase [Pseudomonadota bacterium]